MARLIHNAAIAALAGMLAHGDPMAYRAASKPDKRRVPTAADLARRAAAEAKRERKRERRARAAKP